MSESLDAVVPNLAELTLFSLMSYTQKLDFLCVVYVGNSSFSTRYEVRQAPLSASNRRKGTVHIFVAAESKGTSVL
jgi:hypothetical protein